MSDISQWSTTDASNNSAAPNGAPEGMAPSSVNDTMRAMMGAIARFYEDVQGGLTTAGTSNAYTLTTNCTHAALADQSLLVFRADRANTGAATLNVDALGAKAIEYQGAALASGMLVLGSIYAVAYNATNDTYDLLTATGLTVSNSRLITSGAGLTGGGDLSADRTLAVGAGTGITVNADDVALAATAAGTGMTHTSGVLNVIGGDGITANANDIALSATVAGNGMTYSTGVLHVGGGTGITANANDIAVDLNQLTTEVAIAGGDFLAMVDITDSGSGKITKDNLNASFTLAALSDYDANDHIDHTTVQVIAGSGLTGGGTIAADRTLNVGAGTGITVAADAISTNDAAIVHNNLSGFLADEHVAHSGVTMTAGAGLTGGGNIALTRTFDVGAGTGITVNANDVALDIANSRNADHGTINITAGSGLTGGGSIAATRTLNVGAGTGITVAADAVSTNDSAIVHDNLSGFVGDEHIDHSTVSLSAGTGISATGLGNLTASRTINANVASTTTQGVIELATEAEVLAGTDTTRAVTPDTLATALGTTLYKATTTTRANDATLSDDPDLAGWALTTGEWYKIEGYLEYLSGGSQIQGRFQFSDTPSNAGWSFTAPDVTTGHHFQADGAGTTTLTLSAVSNRTYGARISGVFQANATTGGTVDFQWSQTTSNAAGAAMNAGCWITVTRIS